MGTEMQQRRGTAADWASVNPILGDGEIGFARDSYILKIGDGATHWNDLDDFEGPPGATGAAGATGPTGPSGLGGILSAYGNSSDRALVFDGTSTIAGATRSGTTYTLNRDFHCTNMTVNSGVTIVALWTIYVSGTLTNNGMIHNSASGVTAANNGKRTGGTSPGGPGGVGTGLSTTNPPYFTLGATGGAGGGTAIGVGGGAGGTANTRFLSSPKALDQVFSIFNLAADPNAWGGTGGGGGQVSTGTAGTGGGGGGQLFVFANIIAGTGIIAANGGNGTAGTGGNAGGGGGGGAGIVCIMSSSISAGAITGQTLLANGGSGGAGAGTKFAGASGGTGQICLIPG